MTGRAAGGHRRGHRPVSARRRAGLRSGSSSPPPTPGWGRPRSPRRCSRSSPTRGLRPAPFKPYESGCERLDAPADALALRAAARSDDPLERICVHRFRAPLAPGVAARRLGRRVDFRPVLSAYRSFAGRPMVAEGAGGLLVPLDARRDVVDLIALLHLPVLLVARAGLGTLNHTGLSLALLRGRRGSRFARSSSPGAPRRPTPRSPTTPSCSASATASRSSVRSPGPPLRVRPPPGLPPSPAPPARRALES